MNAPLRRRGLLAAVIFVLLLIPIACNAPGYGGRRGHGRPVSGASAGPRGAPTAAPGGPEFRVVGSTATDPGGSADPVA